MARVAKILLIAGSVTFVGAVAWWYAFYQQFLGENVKLASDCFYFERDFCVLADAAELVSRIPAYSPAAFWSAVALLGAGILALAAAPGRRP
ncbi:MAG: hypothetical protein EA406_09065 [Rhodospirillales bacterium]|nr:MAG: hypothetical protein EA406_09065 [Rhodospirillales bacterium]